jgi:RNA polymerase sigma factor (sigma-70 family)
VRATNGRVERADAQESSGQADDAYLVALAQADPWAFAHLYDRYIDPIHRYCHRRLGSVAAAEDATSATFEKAFAALPRFDPEGGGFRAWLFTIAHNVVMNHLRQTARRGDRSLDAAADVEDAERSPEATAIANDEASALNAALLRLTDEQRHVLELRLAGLTGPEIAAALGISHAAVRTAQHRALLRLRAVLCSDAGASLLNERSNHG